MGCDIHPVLEKRWKNSDGCELWVGVHNYPIMRSEQNNSYAFPRAQRRNYKLFAKLAGVRGDGPEPRGLPDDASDLSLMMLGDINDLHSHSWATAQEWVEACLSVEPDPEKIHLDPENGDDPRVKHPYEYYLDLDVDLGYEYEGHRKEDYRIVFAFDN